MAKVNDWFAARLFQPDFTLVDFYAHNITPDNSTMKSADEYKNLPEVQEVFKDKSGRFDEKKFNDFYNTSLALYNQYDNDEVEKRLVEAYVHDPYEWYTPGNQTFREVGASIVLGKNPLGESQGIKGILYNGPSQYSVREIAQREKVHDENGNELDWSPNDKGGLFKGLFRPTLVLAQYDEDGTHEVDGKIVSHKKGDLKYNEDGRPYYELLGDREMYGKDLLHYTDTLTIDGKGLNAIDVFDNDGLTKSIGGTLMKTALTMGPLLIPGVGPVYGAIRASIATAQILPILGKTLDSIISGDKETEIDSTLNRLESWTSRFNSSVSDAGRQKMFSVENLGSMINAIGGQLFEQRVVGAIPRLLNKYGNITANTRAGQNLAQAYMAATSARETYQAFKEAGANDRTAGIAMAANIFALWKLMNIDYFRKSIFRGSYLDDSVVKTPSLNVAKMYRDELTGVVKEGTEQATKQTVQQAATQTVQQAAEDGTQAGSKKLFKSLTEKFSKSLKDGIKNTVKSSEFRQRSIAEGVEEIMEENISDLSKVFTLGLEALGINTGDQDLDFGYSWNEILSRYAMTFGGGVIGGAIFQGFGKWEKFLHPESAATAWDNLGDLEKMTYFIANGRKNEIQSYYDKWHQQGRLGSTNLSADKGSTLKLPGKEGEWTANVDSKYTQNDAVYRAVTNHLNYLENLINEEGLTDFSKKLPKLLQIDTDKLDDPFVRASIVNQIAAQGGMLRDFSRLGAKLIKTRAELQRLTESIRSSAQNDSKEAQAEVQEKLNNNLQIKKQQDKLLKLRTERDAILNGERNDYYVERGLFRLDGATSSLFGNISKESFAQTYHGINYSSLNDDQKAQIDEEYNDFMAEKGQYLWDIAFNAYDKLSERYAPQINQLDQILQNKKRNTQYSKELYSKKRDDLVKERNKIVDEVNKLNSKPESERTNEEQQKLLDLETEAAKLKTQIEKYDQNPGLFLEFLGAPNSEIEKLQRILDDQSGDIALVADTIKNIYNEYKKSQTLLFNDAELDRFYDWVREDYKKRGLILDQLFQYGQDWRANQPEFGYDDDAITQRISKTGDASRDIFRYDETSDIQKEFTAKFDEFINLFGKDNKRALEIYEELNNFLKEQTNLEEADIKALMDHLTPVVGTQSIVDFMKEMDDIRKDILYSPFSDLFNQLTVELTGEKMPILDLVKSEELRLGSVQSLQDYTIENPLAVQQLENAQQLLDIFTGMISGAYDGLNATANKYRKQLQKPTLGILSDHSAKLIGDEILALKNRITTLLQISKNNGQNKLTIQKKIAANMRPKFTKTLLDPLYSDVIKDATGMDLAQEFEDNVKPDSWDWNDINESNYTDKEETFIKFESLVYDKLHNLTEDQLDILYDKLLTIDTVKMVSSKLTDNKDEKLSSYDLAVYLTTLMSLDSNDYYAKLKSIIESPDFNVAPLYGQEFDVRTSVAAALHPTRFNKLLDKLKSIKDLPDVIKNKTPLYNTSFIFGGAGVGKTVVMARLISKMVDDPAAEIVLLAPSQKQVDKLQKETGLDKATARTLDEVFKEITDNPNGIEARNIYYPKDLRYARPKDINIKDLDPLFTEGAKHKYIIIDEVAVANSVQLDLLSQYAQKVGARIIGLGDPKQTSAKITYQATVDGTTRTITDYSGLEDTLHIKSPFLTASLRPSNVAKLDNYYILDTKLSSVLDEYQNHPEWTSADISNATTLALSSGITLKYYDGNNRLVGDKMVKDSDALIVDINKVLGFKDGTIAIYTDNPSKYATFADKKNVEILPADNINGGEYDYTFVDIDWKKRATVGGDLNNFTLLQDLYTVSQRSKMATVFVNNGLIKDGSGTYYLNINVENSANAGAPLNMSKTSFDTFKTWRLQGLKNIKPSSHFDQSFAADDAHRQVANNANSGNTPPLNNNTPTGNNPSNNTPPPSNPPAPKVKLSITPQEWTNSKRQEFIDNTIRNIENKHSDTELSDPNFWAKYLSKEYEDKIRIKFNSNYEGITWETEGKSAWEEARMNLMLTHSPESVALFYKNDIIAKFIESLENNPSINLSDPNTWYDIESIVEANFPLSAEVYKHLKTDIAKALGAVQAKYMPVNPQLSLDEAKNVWDSILQPMVDDYAKSLSIESFTTHSYDDLVKNLKDSLWKKLDEYPELSKEAQKYIEKQISKINRPLKAEFDQVILEDAWATNVDIFTNQITTYDPNQIRDVFEKINNYLNAFKYIDDKFKNDYRNRLQSVVNNKYESLKPTKSAEEQVAELKDQVKNKWLEWLQSDSKYQDGKYWKEHESEIVKQAIDIYSSFFNGPKAWKNSGRFLWNDFVELYKRDHINSVPETNTPKTPKTSKDYSFSTNDNDYYDFLFSENFINIEVGKPNSLLNLFNKNMTADRYKDLVWLLGSIVKYNEDVKNYYQAIRDLFRGTNIKEQEEINKFVTILKDNNTNTYMEVTPYNDKGLLSLVIESPTNKYTVPISFVDTQGKFGRYTGQLTQVQRLSFSKSGNWISLSELQQKYPALHVGKDWAIVGRPDIENDPNYTDRTKTLVAVNKGKVMVMVTSNKLDTDQELRSLWREGIGEDIQKDAEGNEVKFNWSYSHHEQIPLIGIHKRDKLSNVIPFAFAMQAKMSKLRKEFTPEFLATLGLVYDSNGVLKDNSVFKLLGDPVAFGNIVEPIGSQKGEYALWRRRNIDDYSVQIIPSDRLGELVKSILISDFKDATLRKELNNNISNFVKQKPDKNNNRNGLLLISPTLDALIQYNTDSNVYEVFAFDTKTYTIGNKIQEFKPQGTNIFNDLRSSGIDFSEAKVYFTHTYVVNNTLRLSTHTANQTITDIFKGVSNIDNIDELLKDEEAFKYGVFVNDRAGDWYSGSKFYRQFRGNKEGYITDADTWTFPIYQLDESKIIVETVSQPNSDPVEEVDDFNERVNTLKQTLTDLKYPYNLDTLLNPGTWTQEVWNDTIDRINPILKVHTTLQTYPIIGQDGKLERYGRSVFNSFLNTMFVDEIRDVNPIHVIPLTNIKASKDVPFAIFAITDKVNEDGMLTEELNINNAEYWVYKYDGNRATVQRTYTYQTWNELYQFIKDANLDNTTKTTLLNYIGQLYNDNIDASIENAVSTMVIDPEIFNGFKERLVKHLQDRLNENLENYEC